VKQKPLLQQTMGPGLSISVPSNASPALAITGPLSYQNVARPLCVCVNFLRSGCPSAQILYAPPKDGAVYSKDEMTYFFHLLHQILFKLSLPHEEFQVAEKGPVALITRCIKKEFVQEKIARILG
jgi:hypothetical protein